jgi:hypothetical protein
MCLTKEEIKKAMREVWETELEPKMFKAIDEKTLAFLPVAIAKGIVESEKHMSPSPQTIERFDNIESWMKEHEVVSSNIVKALFGNSNTEEQGLVKQMKDVHDKVVAFDGIKGFFQWILLTGGVIGMLYAFFKKI